MTNTGFPRGFHIQQDEQEFWPVHIQPRVTRRGETINLVVWCSVCPECGADYRFASTLAWGALPVQDRCGDCKTPRNSEAPITLHNNLRDDWQRYWLTKAKPRRA